ncbi:MAG: hypothetical protein NC041_01450 [Bacteroides sp.]|nr:hypothetical protein [Prevotella sp.]MCM1407732.1 hypothetical protein [Treponema brennaborense]MCM1469118.1 hypothetical protein [Bacteroides sp.]
MVSDIPSLSAASYTSFFSGGISSKLYVPVRPDQVIYSQFEHVSGVVSGSGQSGVPVSKIKILNTLIDQLVKYKNDASASEMPMELSDAQIDALIKDYQGKISAAIQTAKANPFGMSGFAPPTGLIVNTAA